MSSFSHKPKTIFLVELLLVVVKISHDAGGFFSGAVTDNLSVNQKSFKTG